LLLPKGGAPLVAVIDLGTTGNRSVLFDLKGHEVAKAYREFPTVSEEPRQSEQDVENWWRTTSETMHEAIKRAQVDPKDISAVSVCTQRGTLVPLDAKGIPLARAITWMDFRVSPSAEKFEALVKQRTGLRRALWFKDEQPKVFGRTAKFAFPDAFIYHRLTGKLASDLSNHIYGILDRSTLKLSPQLANELGLPIALWPDIVASGTVLGEVTPEAATQTGLAAGTPVVAGGGDQQCSVIGLGVLDKGVAKATTGTGTFVVTPIDVETHDPLGTLFCNPHVLPNQWVLEGVLPGTGATLRWFRDQFCHLECTVAQRVGRDPYDYIIEEAAQAPPGCNGLVLFPFLAFSLGILYGLGFEHSRAHIARAILERGAFAIRFYIDTMASAGVSIEELRLDGGGSRSPLWRQIQCDLTGKRAIFTEVDEGTALGAAILAATGRKHFPTIKQAVKAMVHERQVHRPCADHAEVYNQAYSKFQKILMDNIQDIMKRV
jgi:xylulokinase